MATMAKAIGDSDGNCNDNSNTVTVKAMAMAMTTAIAMVTASAILTLLLHCNGSSGKITAAGTINRWRQNKQLLHQCFVDCCPI